MAVVTAAIKLEREKRRTLAHAHNIELRDKLIDKLLNPTTLRLLALASILGISTFLANKERPTVTERGLTAVIPTVGLPLLAAESGITNPIALAAFSTAGLAYVSMLRRAADEGYAKTSPYTKEYLDTSGYTDEVETKLKEGWTPGEIARVIAAREGWD